MRVKNSALYYYPVITVVRFYFYPDFYPGFKPIIRLDSVYARSQAPVGCCWYWTRNCQVPELLICLSGSTFYFLSGGSYNIPQDIPIDPIPSEYRLLIYEVAKCQLLLCSILVKYSERISYWTVDHAAVFPKNVAPLALVSWTLISLIPYLLNFSTRSNTEIDKREL